MNIEAMLLEVEDGILNECRWGDLPFKLKNGQCIQFERSVTLPNGGLLSLESEASHYERSGSDFYDEYPQGSTDDVWMILRLDASFGEGRAESFFFKKSGLADSYGEVVWDGKFRRVFGKPKTVTVYEYEGDQ